MTGRRWLNADDLTSGTEILRSRRSFQLWAYSPSHQRLLLRSPSDTQHDATIDVLFSGVTAMNIHTGYDSLVISCQSPKATGINPTPVITSARNRMFRLDSAGEPSHVIAGAIGWCEDILGPTRMSFFTFFDPEQPGWARHPLGPGYDAGLDYASTDEIEAALTTQAPRASTGRYGTIYVVMTRMEYECKDREPEIEIRADSAFLTRQHAEDLKARIDTTAADCWIEEVSIAL